MIDGGKKSIGGYIRAAETGGRGGVHTGRRGTEEGRGCDDVC